MSKCKNPECQKEITDNLNYCSETCLGQHIKIKKVLKVEKIKEICKNCGKPVKAGLANFCTKSCLDEYKSKQEEFNNLKEKPELKEILKRMRIFSDNMPKFAYKHWISFLTFLIEENNKEWEEIYSKLRSVVGIDYRYIDDYIKCAKAWDVLIINDNKLHIIFETPKTEESQSFKDNVKEKEKEKEVKK